jgi:predicted secreted protein
LQDVTAELDKVLTAKNAEKAKASPQTRKPSVNTGKLADVLKSEKVSVDKPGKYQDGANVPVDLVRNLVIQSEGSNHYHVMLRFANEPYLTSRVAEYMNLYNIFTSSAHLSMTRPVRNSEFSRRRHYVSRLQMKIPSTYSYERVIGRRQWQLSAGTMSGDTGNNGKRRYQDMKN